MELTVVDRNSRFTLRLLCRLTLGETVVYSLKPCLHPSKLCDPTAPYGNASIAHLAVHDDLVIDAELALGHPGQVRLHQDLGGGRLCHHKVTIIIMTAINKTVVNIT